MTRQQWKCRAEQDLPEKLMFSLLQLGEVRNWNAFKLFETQEVVTITSQLWLTLDPNDPMKLVVITIMPNYISSCIYIYINININIYIYISHDSSMIVPPFWLGRQVAIPVVLKCRIPAEEFALWHWQGRRNPSGVALLAAAAENLARRAGTQSIVHEDAPKKVISVSDWLRTNENDSNCWILGFIWLISIITILLTLN